MSGVILRTTKLTIEDVQELNAALMKVVFKLQQENEELKHQVKHLEALMIGQNVKIFGDK